MELALAEAREAEKVGDPPYGSVLVRDGQVVARGRNLAMSTRDFTAHAECMVLRNAGPATGATEFSGCALYTTAQPCPMCLGTIIWGRVSTLVIGYSPGPGEGLFGRYTIEGFLELTNWTGKLTVVRGVLQDRAEAMINEWRKGQGLPT